MLSQLRSHSRDIDRLINEGYDLRVVNGFLIVGSVPYRTSEGTVAHGALVDPLAINGSGTGTPFDHTVRFTGSPPHGVDGQPMNIRNADSVEELAAGLTVTCSFSQKPAGATNYADYHAKFSTYANIIAGPAMALDPSVTPRLFPPIADDDDYSPFQYMDNASSRAGIVRCSDKLKLNKVAIVGLGGTGGYILDQIAKCPIREIHLFDDDVFSQHNAFRAPGAASIAQLAERPLKVHYYADMYAPMRTGIVAHPHRMTSEHASELEGMDFVFIAYDPDEDKRQVVESLASAGVPAIAVGAGVLEADGRITAALLRTSLLDPTHPERLSDSSHVPLSPDAMPNVYDRNIQVADLNALNALFAVLRFKRWFDFYVDLEGEHHSVFSVPVNDIINRAQP